MDLIPHFLHDKFLKILKNKFGDHLSDILAIDFKIRKSKKFDSK